ncbi:MAG: CzcE family metal-binding protein [Burkholderiaceae bacterium]
MKYKMLSPIFIAMLLLTSCAAIVDQDRVMSLWGDSAPLSAATRTIVIDSNTKYVNVEGGEIVKFIAGDKTFAWAFAPQGGAYFELNKIAPPGALDHRVMAASTVPERYLPSM